MRRASWNPFYEMEELLDRYGRERPRATRERAAHEIMTTADWTPPVDIRESVEEYLIKVELPEIAKDKVKITIKDDVLLIQGERKLDEVAGSKYHRVERSYGVFARSFALPEDAEPQSIKAEHRDGMLYIHVAKHQAPLPKSIEIKVQ